MLGRRKTARNPNSSTARRLSATASSMSNTDTIPAPSSRPGSAWQKSYSQLLYARATAAASGGSISGSPSACSPRLG